MTDLGKIKIGQERPRAWRSALAVVACALSFLASASEFDSDFETKPWEEIAVQIPVFPSDED